MPSTDEVRDRIERALPGAQATVTDLTGGGDHLRAEVVYQGFAGLSRIQQHKLVNQALAAPLADGTIHELRIRTKGTA
mgnify:CR=1 FL=1